MNQFYFLSVFCNLAAGIVLLSDRVPPRGAASRGLRELATSAQLRLALAILSLLTGAMKLVSVARGDYEIYGDLFPAIAGIVAGLSLALSLAAWKPAGRLGRALNAAFTAQPAPVGVLALLAAFLHFLFPSVSIL